MKNTMTGNEIKQALAKKFKTSPRDFRAVHDKYSMGSSYDIEVKKIIPITKVRDFVASLNIEHIDRCEASGEILSGGNTFVSVNYARDLEIPIDVKIKLIEARLKIQINAKWDNDCAQHFVDYLDDKKVFGDNFNKEDISHLVHNLGNELWSKISKPDYWDGSNTIWKERKGDQ